MDPDPFGEDEEDEEDEDDEEETLIVNLGIKKDGTISLLKDEDK